MMLIEDEKKIDNFNENPLEQKVVSVDETSFETWFAGNDLIDNFLIHVSLFLCALIALYPFGSLWLTYFFVV